MPKLENKICLPKDHFSWSQFSIFKSSPKTYRRIYIDGEEIIKGRFIEFGKDFAKMREDGNSDDLMMAMADIALPSFKKKEFNIEAMLKINGNNILLVGRPDNFDKKTLSFADDKTSKNPWTQSMVDRLGQLTFYCLILWLGFRRLPKKIILNWAETAEDEFGEIYLTGKFKSFETKRSVRDVLLMASEVQKAILKISKMIK